MINYNIDINCEEPRISTSTLELVSGDVGAYNLCCAFFSDGKRMDLSSLLATLKAKRADGVILSQSGKIIDNRAVFKLENGIYAVPGELYLEIALSDSAKNYVTAKVILANVIKGLGETDETAKSETSVYVTLLNQTQEKLSQAESLLSGAQGVLSDVYTKDETDAKLGEKANGADVYTRSETDAKLGEKANVTDVYTKASVDAKIGKKANGADVYTKSETDAKLDTLEKNVYTKSDLKYMLWGKGDAEKKIYSGNQFVVEGDLSGCFVYGKVTVGKDFDFSKDVANVWITDSTTDELVILPAWDCDWGDGTFSGTLTGGGPWNVQVMHNGNISNDVTCEFVCVMPYECYTKDETDAKFNDMADALRKTASGILFNISGALPGSRAKCKVILDEGATLSGLSVGMFVLETGESNTYIPRADGTFEAIIPSDKQLVVEVYRNNSGAPKAIVEIEYAVLDVSQLKEEIKGLKDGKADANDVYVKAEVDNKIGDIETALDNIIAIQNELIGGDSV
ncbi:MAG: hypothetical protein IKU87_02410 [Clostridia bacterium]|nr:hypothetical protein [Clostridia bacterium]